MILEKMAIPVPVEPDLVAKKAAVQQRWVLPERTTAICNPSPPTKRGKGCILAPRIRGYAFHPNSFSSCSLFLLIVIWISFAARSG